MGKNAYLAQQKALKQAYFEAGLESGRQQIMDMIKTIEKDHKQ